jgi:beta-glucosidase
MLSDGPHGLRKQSEKADHLAVNESIVANCFPAGSATASSFDRELMRELGERLGRQCQAESVAVVLGPGMNIKRNPLCGRNFEYLSEDPYLCGELAAAYTQGVQSQNVGVSAKHFALNNQEHERMAGSSECDERTMREIYLAGFETLVRKAKPWTVMNSYNKINGVFAGESHWLLTQVLRDEWGFDGYVMSDWGAVSDRVAALKAGLDLEMPASGAHDNDRLIVEAVRAGTLDEAVLDRAVERILAIHDRFLQNRQNPVWDKDADHQAAVELAGRCAVLLQNDGLLPLHKNAGKIAFVGGFADKPRYQGGGSSHINTYKTGSSVESARKYADIVYAEGFHADDDIPDPVLHSAAVRAAQEADAVVVFAGLPDSYESEGYDRAHMRLPDCQNALIADVLKVNPRVAVVLQNGSPVELPWADQVSAVLECYLGGEGVAEAVPDLLFGEVNPGGKLPESWPLRYQDTPSSLFFPGKGLRVHYAEGVFVGYRYYDAKEMDVRYPFGHGLSYTRFALSDIKLSAPELREGETLTVSVTVQNVGAVAGREVVQLYVRDDTASAVRPVKELKGFASVALQPGQSETVSMELDARSFQWYNTDIGDWYAATGDYTLLVGTSSRDIRLEQPVRFVSAKTLPFTVTQDTQVGDLLRYPAARKFLEENVMSQMPALSGGTSTPEWAALMEAMMRYMPLRGLRSFGPVTHAQTDQLVAALNQIVQA